MWLSASAKTVQFPSRMLSIRIMPVTLRHHVDIEDADPARPADPAEDAVEDRAGPTRPSQKIGIE